MDDKNQKDKYLIEQDIKNLDIDSLRHDEHELFKTIVEAVEKPLIEKALERTYGNQLKAAKILGINRNTLRTKIKKLGIKVEKWKF